MDGFCSPIGAGWESVVTSEFGYRSDPFTGETRGHTGMDLAVPTGTPIRAALPGTVTVSQYNSSYGYYVMIDHGNGLSTLVWPQLTTAGPGGSDGRGRRHHFSLRFHRAVHRAPPPLRGACQRGADKSKILFTDVRRMTK